NAGTWFIGRLQTERDKARILEGLQSAGGEADVSALDKAISGLEQRRFVLHNTHESTSEVFSSRWAMSYLRGPLTKEQIQVLMKDAPEREMTRTVTATGPAGARARSAAPADASVATAPAHARGGAPAAQSSGPALARGV